MFNLSNIQETNPSNTKALMLIEGMSGLMKEFWLSNKHSDYYYEGAAEYHFVKIKRHISFVITDLATEDKVTGYAVIAKKNVIH